jgi:hypothetical protein
VLAGIVVSSLIEELPRGIMPAFDPFFETAKRLAQERHWA